MSDYRFGDDYKLNIYPKDAIDCWGEIDMDKVESVEIEWVDFVRKPDDKSRWAELFGTPERAARTMMRMCDVRRMGCYECPLYTTEVDDCDDYDTLLEWLMGDAE